MAREREWPQEIGQKEPVYGNFRRPAHMTQKPPRRLTLRYGMDPEHLVLVRRLPCCVCPDRRGVEPHHLKSLSAARERGLGMKATDRWSVPLCWLHHKEIERIASIHEPSWFQRFAIDPHSLATALWNARGDLDAMLRVIDAHKTAAIRALAQEWRRQRGTAR